MATRTVVFDMDGTLVQTRAASWDVFQDTAIRFGLPVRSADEFFELFRGNFYESLSQLCGDPALEAGVREHFLQGLRERYAPAFIPGMRDVVKELAGRFPLAVMSSNAMGAIRRILENEGLAHCFAHVFSGDVGASKEASLRQILNEPSYGNARHCSPSYVESPTDIGSCGVQKCDVQNGQDDDDVVDVVLITDTVGDVREARKCGARAIGVAWGMHSGEALLAAGAESVALWPQELLATLLPGSAGGTGSRSSTGFCIGTGSGSGTGSGGSCRCSGSGSCQPRPSDLAKTPSPGPMWAAATVTGSTRRIRRTDAARTDPRGRVGGPGTGVGTSVGTVTDAPALRRTPRAGPEEALVAALHRIAPRAR